MPAAKMAIMAGPGLQRGDHVPHVSATSVAGDTIHYADIWQQRNLVLVVLDADGAAEPYAAELLAKRAAFAARDTELIVTRDPIPGLVPHGVVVADRWGEITHVTAAAAASQLPGVEEILDWVDFTRMRCPECEGEWE